MRSSPLLLIVYSIMSALVSLDHKLDLSKLSSPKMRLILLLLTCVSKSSSHSIMSTCVLPQALMSNLFTSPPVKRAEIFILTKGGANALSSCLAL